MSYVKSLRFKLMLLCVIPLLSVGFMFIAHSVFIANQVRDLAADVYTEAAQTAGADAAVTAALSKSVVDLGWLGPQWSIFFGVMFVFCYIPITINIRKFILPIRQAAKYADSLAAGDVSIQVTVNRTDEIGILQQSFEKLVQSSRKQAALIRRMSQGDLTELYTPASQSDTVGQSLVTMIDRNNEALLQVKNSSMQLRTASRELSDGSQLLAQGSTQQSAAIEELSAHINEIFHMNHRNAELIGNAAAISSSIRDSAEKGSRQMEEMVSAIQDIHNASQRISNIIKVIDDIAFQTNILALNASVEAARAGQHGKGFAVVAEEVRSLASKSADAARDTGRIISESMEKAELGVSITHKTASSLSEITVGLEDSNRIVNEVAVTYQSQTDALSVVNSSIDQISQVTQQTSATAEESASASAEMSEQADMLYSLVADFKLRETAGLSANGRSAALYLN